MEIKYKKIILENQKKCNICGRDSYKDGIIIMKNSICQNCIDNIISIEVSDRRYESIKEKIKNIWTRIE